MKILSSHSRKLIAGTALTLALSLPLHAADKPVEIRPLDVADVPAVMATPTDDTAVATTEPGMAETNPFAMLEKFSLKKPIVDLPKPDPARLAVAEKVAAALYSDGTSKRIFTAARTELLQPLFDRFWTMKESEFAELFGMDMPESTEVDEAGNEIPRKDETLGEALGEKDPNAKERIEAFAKVYLDLLGEMSEPLEPDLRGAMARDFARRYTKPQLTEMAKFFATPTGAVFGRDYWLSSMSLDIIQTSMMVWPKAMKAVPDFEERLKKADAHLPPAPAGSIFGKPDLSYLPECAQDGDESDCTDADWAAMDAATAATDAAAAAADATAAVNDDEASQAAEKKLRAAWSKKDLKAVEKAEAEQEKLGKQHEDIDAKLDESYNKVQAAIDTAKRNAGQSVEEEHVDGMEDNEL